MRDAPRRDDGAGRQTAAGPAGRAVPLDPWTPAPGRARRRARGGSRLRSGSALSRRDGRDRRSGPARRRCRRRSNGSCRHPAASARPTPAATYSCRSHSPPAAASRRRAARGVDVAQHQPFAAEGRNTGHRQTRTRVPAHASILSGPVRWTPWGAGADKHLKRTKGNVHLLRYSYISTVGSDSPRTLGAGPAGCAAAELAV